MADTQIAASQVETAPLVYQLPSAVEFILKAVNADFTDNGALTDWLPAVVIGSDSGHVIAYAVDQAVVVTGGDDAAVSWFPGVKHASGGSTALDLARAFGEADLTTDTTHADYFTFVSSDTSIISYDATNKRIEIWAEGTYLVFHGWNFATSNAAPAVTERAALVTDWSHPGGGGISHKINSVIQQATVAGVLDVNGTTKHWDAFVVEIASLSAAFTVARHFVTATKSGATNMPGDLETTIVRIATTDMGDLV